MLEMIFVFGRWCWSAADIAGWSSKTLRQQLHAPRRSVFRPRLRRRDRLFWIVLAQTWRHWRAPLVLVQPDTLVRWHREWLRRRWTWRCAQIRAGRPSTDAAIRTLVGRMAAANPLWGAPPIHGELEQSARRGIGGNRLSAPPALASSAITGLADLLDQSRRHARVDGFLHRPNPLWNAGRKKHSSRQYSILAASRFIGGLDSDLKTFESVGQDGELQDEFETLREQVTRLEQQIATADVAANMRRAFAQSAPMRRDSFRSSGPTGFPITWLWLLLYSSTL